MVVSTVHSVVVGAWVKLCQCAWWEWLVCVTVSLSVMSILPAVQGLDIQDPGSSISLLYNAPLDIQDMSVIQAFGLQIQSGQNTEERPPGSAAGMHTTTVSFRRGEDSFATCASWHTVLCYRSACIWLCSLCMVYAWISLGGTVVIES